MDIWSIDITRGTPKQIAWAKSIQAERTATAIIETVELIAAAREDGQAKEADVFETELGRWARSAQFWIDAKTRGPNLSQALIGLNYLSTGEPVHRAYAIAMAQYQ